MHRAISGLAVAALLGIGCSAREAATAPSPCGQTVLPIQNAVDTTRDALERTAVLDTARCDAVALPTDSNTVSP